MAERATRTRTIWKGDQHGSYLVVITEPASWWRRQWERLVEFVVFDVAEPLVAVLGFVLFVALVIVLALFGEVPDDTTGQPTTFSTWGPPSTFPTTMPTAPTGLR